MSEDRFFQNIRSTMVEYSPEVPQSVYTGMRKKLWWSDFTKISASRFNIWYALLIVTSASLLINYSLTDATQENEGATSPQSELPKVVNQDLPASPAHETSANTQAIGEIMEGTTSKAVRPTAAPAASHEEKSADVVDRVPATEKTSEQTLSVETAAEGKKDSVTSSGKGVKRGLKVKTFQGTDK